MDVIKTFQSMDSHVLVLGGLVVILSMIFLILQRPKGKNKQSYNYSSRANLTSKTETLFYHALCEAVGGRYIVFSKVRIADVLTPKKGIYNRAHWQRAFNLIAQKHFDFVLCDPEDLSFKYVIELDDKSHDRKDRQRRDAFVGEACTSAALPLIRFRAASNYSAKEIKKKLFPKEKNQASTEKVSESAA